MSTIVVEPRYLSYKDVETYCSVSRWTIYRAMKRGELTPCQGLGSAIRFDRREIDRWVRGEGA